MDFPLNIANQLRTLNPQPNSELGKLEDAGILVPQGRVDRRWGTVKPKDWTGKKLDVKKYRNTFATDATKFVEHFGLRSVEFGNWMNQKDRMNFLFNTAISLQDLANVLKIQADEIGLQRNISIALGARGQGGPALAHYEQLTYSVINLTKTGGNLGVLAHEYGHALDNLITLAVNGNSMQAYITGDTTSKRYLEKKAEKGQFHNWFEDFFHALYYEDKGNKSAFYRQMVKMDSEYWESRVEVWARYFEMYISYLLKESQRRNTFLAQSWAGYSTGMPYPNLADFFRALPFAKKIISTGIKLMLGKGELRAYGIDKDSLSDSQKKLLRLDLPANQIKKSKATMSKQNENFIGYALIDNISGEAILFEETIEKVIKGAKELDQTKGMETDKLIIFEVKKVAGKKKATNRVTQELIEKALSDKQLEMKFNSIGAIEIVGQNKSINNNGYFPSYPQLDDYSHLISLAGPNGMLIKNTDLDTTLEEIKRIVGENKDQVSALAQHLKAETIEQTAFNVWHFIKHNIVYDFDLPGVEEIRTPAQTWKDREHRADCEDMAIFTAAILENLNIPYQLTVVAFNGAKQYGHIYITAFTRANKEIVIDGVMHTFNKHPDNITKVLNIGMHQKKRNMNNAAIKGLGATAPADAITQKLMRVQSSIINQFESDSLSKQQRNYLRAELRKVRYVIMLNGTPERDEVLPLMSALIDIRSNGKFVFADNTKMERVYWYFQKLQEGYTPQEIEGMIGLGSLDGWFQDQWEDIKDGAQKVGDAVQDAGEFVSRNLKSAWDDIKEGGQKVIDGIKTGLTKYNPALIVGRNSFLFLTKMNVFNIAGKLGQAYNSKSEAINQGISPSQWSKNQELLNKIENTWEKLGGDTSSLRKNAIEGREKKMILAGIPGNGLGEPASVSTAIGSAASIIAAVMPLIKQISGGDEIPDEIATAIEIDPETGQPKINQEKLKKIALDYGKQKGQDFLQDQLNRRNSTGQDTSSNSENSTPTPQENGYANENERKRANNELNDDENNNNQAGYGSSWLSWFIPASVLIGGFIYTQKNN